MSAPAFFVPDTDPEHVEERYAGLAKWAQRPVPPLGERVYSITYMHDGEEWTATVGEQLAGVRRKEGTSRGRRIERVTQLADPATVLAILPGTPYIVVTDHRTTRGVRSAWENPFMAGRPRSVTLFQNGGGGGAP